MNHHPPADDRERLVAAGVLLRYADHRPHPALGHSTIGYVSTALWYELTALAISPDAAAATAHALLRTIAADAVDAALAPGNETAPRDDLYVTHPAYIGPRRRTVWFQRSGPRGLVTAMFPP
ncbi:MULTISPECIES: hypothetical protein [Streptomycetaceae]|uniref:Uncharacterized protein n=1 Tax=Kitasatospora purpeofusca TaxID=67352 RepID=A0ABZ1TSV2_9ACTN|nr:MULTISPECIES: hypothetical protein [Streptomycetaceae]KJY35034.1 hypothetical protein VR45_15190 [Streptomyces sp. NRRL S-495]